MRAQQVCGCVRLHRSPGQPAWLCSAMGLPGVGPHARPPPCEFMTFDSGHSGLVGRCFWVLTALLSTPLCLETGLCPEKLPHLLPWTGRISSACLGQRGREGQNPVCSQRGYRGPERSGVLHGLPHKKRRGVSRFGVPDHPQFPGFAWGTHRTQRSRSSQGGGLLR